MQKQVIAVDIDDVLVPFVHNIAQYHNEQFGSSHSVEDFVSYNYHETWGGTRERAINIGYKYHMDGHSSVLKPFPDARPVLGRLKRRYDLYVITSRMSETAELTRAWVAQYFPDIFVDVILTNHYAKSGTALSKGAICRQIGAGWLIDDNPGYLQEAVTVGVKAILFGDYSWNRQTTAQVAAHCKDWKDVEEYFCRERP